MSSDWSAGRGSADESRAAPSAWTSARTESRRAFSIKPTGVPLQRVVKLCDGFSVFGFHLHDFHVLASRPLRALSTFERDGLTFAKVVEARLFARRIVEEVSLPSLARMNPNPLSLTSLLIVPFMGAMEISLNP